MIGVALALALLAPSESSCGWLGKLLGLCREVGGPALVRLSGEIHDLGNGAFVVSERYTVRWTGDGRGNADTLQFGATATGQPDQIQAVGNPTFPRTFNITWNDPPVAGSITTRGCARVKRRLLWSTYACSTERTYSTPDQPPPPPVVDTALVQIGLIAKPDSLPSMKPGETVQLCAFIRFGDGKVAMRAADASLCSTHYASLPASVRNTSPAQRASADATCIRWQATGGDIVATTCSVGNLQRSARLAASPSRVPAQHFGAPAGTEPTPGHPRELNRATILSHGTHRL